MTKRAWILLLFFAATLGMYWAYRNYAPQLFPAAAKQPARTAFSPESLRAFKRRLAKPAPPMTLMQALAKVPRPHLQPDQRFLEAAVFVRDFPAEHADPAVTAVFQNGAWTLSQRNQTLGQLPPYPDFTDAMKLLRAEVQQKATKASTACKSNAPALATRVTVFDEKTLENALYALNSKYRASAPDSANLYLAAQALARLTYLEDDKTGTADALYAKAMALVALAEVACGRPMPEEESLLAASMGYSAAAAEAENQSPARDAWKLYFAHDDDDLERMARLNPDSKSANYFWLRRLGDLGRSEDWASWLKERYSGMTTPVYIMDTALLLPGQPPVKLYAYYIPLLVLTALPGTENIKAAPVNPVNDPAAAISLFDKGLPYIKNVATGPYLTAADITAYYRGFFYTGLYEQGYFLLDLLNDLDAAKRYDRLLADAHGEAGSEFHRWYDAAVCNDQGSLNLPELMQDMVGSKMFSRELYYNAWSDTAARTGEWNTSVSSSAWRLATLFDTRTDMRWEYGQILRWIADYPDFEDAFASLAAQESRGASYARLSAYAYRNDYQGLLQIANSRSLPKEIRVTALEDIPDLSEAPRRIRRAYQGIIRDYPADSDAYDHYIKFLYASKNYPDIERVARTWQVSLPPDDSGFDYDNATVSLADAQAKQGHLNHAWVTISQVAFAGGTPPAAGQIAYLATYYARVLAEASYIARMRKDLGVTEYLGHTEADRYPDDLDAQMPFIKALWAEQRYADAAEHLAKWPYPIAPWQWDHVIGADLGTVFKHDTAAGLKAFQALLNSRPRRTSAFDLKGLVLGAGHSSPEVGFTLGQALWPPSMNPANFQGMLQNYEYLKRARGADAALQWFKSNLPRTMTPQQQLMAITLYYGSGNYELLWDLLPDPDSAPHSDDTWLFRAAAYTQHAVLTADQQRALRNHFAGAGDSWYGLLGKYLLKQSGDDAIMDKELEPHALSEASYYAALRALSEHHYRQAQRWLQVDMDTNQQGNGEFIWGRALLSYWYGADQSLAVLDSKGELYTRKQ